MSSESSLLGGMPPSPRLRSSTSAPIIRVMISNRLHAAISMPSSSRPYQRDNVSMAAALLRLGEKFLQLRTGLGTLADDAVPAGLIGLGEIGLRRRGIERDGLDAAVGLALGLLGVLGRERGGGFRLAVVGGLAQHGALRV